MLVETLTQRAVRSAPYVDHPAYVVEKIDSDLLLEIDRLSSNLLHPMNLRHGCPLNRIAAPEHPEGGDYLILDFLFCLFHDCAGLLGDYRLRLPDIKALANFLERALFSVFFDGCD